MKINRAGHQYDDPDVEAYVKKIGREMALKRIRERERELTEEKSEIQVIDALTNGCDDFSRKDLEDFKLGKWFLLDPMKSTAIEAHLQVVEKISKDLSHISQRQCREIMEQFPSGCRIKI